ncbi:recombination protein RecR [Candidatus Desantisbacteria bacterium]|nr:recombination protein RecR [Candidatus Desantisbacteria bacterium]
MMYLTPSMAKLVHELNKLPGIGPKTAQRLAFHILKISATEARVLALAIMEVKDRIKNCPICYNITEDSSCHICQDRTRDHGLICVVEQASDIIAMERTKTYKGSYHVLQGALSPLDGIRPDDLRIDELLTRIQQEEIREIIIATDSDVEGEATALYLERLLKTIGTRVSRIAHGIPVGGNIEYADEVTLSKALESRRML